MKAITLFILIPFISFAQLQFIPISADYAAFNQSDTSYYVEFYVSIFQGNLKYDLRGDTASCTFITKIKIEDKWTVVKEGQHKYQNTLLDTTKYRSYNQFVDVFAFELPKNKYDVKFEVQDLGSQLTGEYVLDIDLKNLSKEINFSDIELATKLNRDDGDGLFNKNGLVVIPNPRNTYDILRPVMYFYVELYGLTVGEGEENTYEFHYFVTNNDGDTVKNIPPKNKGIIASSQVEVGGFNVIALQHDVYFLNLSAVEHKTGKKISKRKKFYVHKPQKKGAVASETGLPDIDSYYSTLTKDELDTEFKIIKYIADKNEMKIYKNLENTEAIRKFLTSFWRTRDKVKNLPIGQSRRNYFQLANYSNQNYAAMRKEGWKTDRGRVLLIYGRPSEIERFPSSLDRMPYVIWYYYELEGGAQFIFCDRDGFGDYELIHSTYRKELSDPDWQRIIYKAGTGSGTFDSGF